MDKFQFALYYLRYLQGYKVPPHRLSSNLSWVAQQNFKRTLRQQFNSQDISSLIHNVHWHFGDTCSRRLWLTKTLAEQLNHLESYLAFHN